MHFNSHAHVERDRVINSSNSIYLISTHTLTWSVTLLKLRALNHSIHFNSHAHVERDMNEFYASGLTNISTHTLTWSVTFSLLAVIFPNVYFNSHAHVERDTFLRRCWSICSNFNSHAHVERDLTPLCGRSRPDHFNSHAHVERDACSLQSCAFLLGISTHTLTWSVTLDVVYIWCLLNVMRTYFFI